MSNLSIISQPPAVALIGDGLKFKLGTSAYLNGTAASLVLDFQGAYTDYSAGAYFDIVAGANTIRFTFSDTPDQSGTQLLSAASTETLADIQNRVLALLQTNFLINQDYTVAINGAGMLQITARNAGTASNISLGTKSIAVLTASATTPGADSNLPADYRVYLAACLISDGINGVPIGEDLLQLDAALEASDNIAAYLSVYLKTAFTFPFIGNNINILPDAVKKYFIRYAEYMNGAFNKLSNTYGNPLLVLPGGLNRMDKDYLNSEESDYFAFQNNAKRFLTWAPENKKTLPDAPERLFFFNQFADVNVKVKGTYADGTTLSKSFDHACQQPDTVFEILCGHDELFSETELTDMLSYEIWIEDNATGEVVSEIRTFEISKEEPENIRTLIFQNSFGMFDLLHFTGKLTTTDNIKRTTVEIYNNNALRKSISSSENKLTYKLNSGWLPGKEYRDWLNEILLSREMYLVVGTFLLSLTNTTSKLLHDEDNVDLYSIELTFEPDYNDTKHSDLVGDGVFVLTDEAGNILTDENDNYLQSI